MEDKYKKNIEEQEALIKTLSKKGGLLGNLRLLIAILTAGFVALLIIYWFSALFLFLLIISFSGFVFLTVLHADITNIINYGKGIIKINKEYIKRISGEWKSFSDNGAEFADYNHSYSHDLDIFGDKSLFQLINVTKTPFGRQRLREDLSSPGYSREDIEERQSAINELAGLDKFAFDCQYYGEQIKFNKDLPKVIKYVKEKNEFVSGKILKFILRAIPFVNIALCATFFMIGTTGFRIAAGMIMIIQLLLWGGFSLKTLAYLGNSEKIHYSLSDYSDLYQILESQKFASKTLIRLQSDLTSSEISAATATKQLGRVLQRIQMRCSGIMYILLNIIFLWDISCSLSLSSWTNKYGKYIENWFTSLGEFESLLSFSVLGGILLTKTNAKVSLSKHIYSVKNIGHPLINNSDRVCNSFTLEKNINIISGSNMSGKTTFLRTLGINLVLARNGSFVCAEAMTFSNMEIVSSMRISDDLTDGISTFYSELRKIKRILETVNKNPDTLFLIDEIFRGTNSSDRMAGAKAVIRKLKEYNAYGFLTTHDLKLCENSDGLDIANFNFSERYENDKLKFDYKIKVGVAQTTNGEYLMRLIGIM